MKRMTYYAAGTRGGNRTGNLLHVETDGCIVNIHVGLTDHDGNTVTRVDIIPDDEGRGGDGQGRMWHAEDVDGNQLQGVVARVVRQPLITRQPDVRSHGGYSTGETVIFLDTARNLEALADITGFVLHGTVMMAELDVDGARQDVPLAAIRPIAVQ